MFKRFPDSLSRRMLDDIWIYTISQIRISASPAAAAGAAETFIVAVNEAYEYFERVYDVMLQKLIDQHSNKNQKIKESEEQEKKQANFNFNRQQQQQQQNLESRVLNEFDFVSMIHSYSIEAAHFFCQVCRIMGDLIRYKNLYEKDKYGCLFNTERDKKGKINNFIQI